MLLGFPLAAIDNQPAEVPPAPPAPAAPAATDEELDTGQ
jgi:hypothetical protein